MTPCTHPKRELRRRRRFGQRDDVLQSQCENPECLRAVGKPIPLDLYGPDFPAKRKPWLSKPKRKRPGRRKRAQQDFYRSPTWRNLRAQRLQHDGFECQAVVGREFCGDEATEVHHLDYTRFGGGELLSDLVSVCQSCHAADHEQRIGGAR